MGYFSIKWVCPPLNKCVFLLCKTSSQINKQINKSSTDHFEGLYRYFPHFFFYKEKQIRKYALDI